MSYEQTGRNGLFDLIGKMARQRYLLGERGFARLGLNHTEARILTLLSNAQEAPTQDALSSQLTVDRSNAGRALKSLEQRQLVLRMKDCADGRTSTVHLTEEGRKHALHIQAMRVEMAHTFFGTLTDEQADHIMKILDGAMRSSAGEESR
jgi:DNA-binding MarR family transcriptional regulator